MEPPQELEAELDRREAAWAYWPDEDTPITVTIPVEDLILIGRITDGWRAAARAYKTAGEFRQPGEPDEPQDPPPEAGDAEPEAGR